MNLDREFVENRILDLKKDISKRQNDIPHLDGDRKREAKDSIFLMQSTVRTNELLLQKMREKYIEKDL